MPVTLYQLAVSPSRLDTAILQILTTWQAGDSLLLLGLSALLADTIGQNYPQFIGKIVLLSNQLQHPVANFPNVSHNAQMIDDIDWLALTQNAHTVMTLDFY